MRRQERPSVLACISFRAAKWAINCSRTLTYFTKTAFLLRTYFLSSQSKGMWAVVGGGPCGIASVGKLVDHGFSVTWFDTDFAVGRMGKYYRHVPSNTKNGDLLTALKLSKSLDFESSQQKQRNSKKAVMSDKDPDLCFELNWLVTALEDCTSVLRKKVNTVNGIVKEIFVDGGWNRWNIYVHSTTGLSKYRADVVLLCTGCKPTVVNTASCIHSTLQDISDIKFHCMDLMVNPLYCSNLLQHSSLRSLASSTRSDVWAVVGSSHSAMLIVKNLFEAGAKTIINLYRSNFRFMHTTIEGWKRYVVASNDDSICNYMLIYTVFLVELYYIYIFDRKQCRQLYRAPCNTFINKRYQ